MAAFMSRKIVEKICRPNLLIKLLQRIQLEPRHHLMTTPYFQFSRSLFSAHGCTTCSFHKTASDLSLASSSWLMQSCHRKLGVSYSTSSQSSEETHKEATHDGESDDRLYKWIELKVKGHDDAVLESYAKYVSLAASELDITVDGILKPTRHIKKLTLLKSRHIYKKHRVQYEMRTYYRVIKLKHMTGSTASVFLEYIERNLPEGLAMQVKKCAIQKLPDHLLSRPEQLEEDLELSSSSSSDSSSDSDSEEGTAPHAR